MNCSQKKVMVIINLFFLILANFLVSLDEYSLNSCNM